MCHSNATHIRFCDLWDARYVAIDSGAGKIVLPKLEWSVPIVQPNDVRKVNLYNSIAANTSIVSYASM